MREMMNIVFFDKKVIKNKTQQSITDKKGRNLNLNHIKRHFKSECKQYF